MKQLRHRRTILIIAICLMAAAAAIIAIILERPAINVADNVSKSVDFSITLPRHLPEGVSVVTEPSYDSSKKIVVTELKTSNNSKMIISQQKKPDIDLKQIDAKETYLTSVGTVYILKGESGRIQAIIDTKDSWIMVNADGSVGNATFKDVITRLR